MVILYFAVSGGVGAGSGAGAVAAGSSGGVDSSGSGAVQGRSGESTGIVDLRGAEHPART